MQKTFVPVAKLVAQYILAGFIIALIFCGLVIIPYRAQCSQIIRMISILAILCSNIYCHQILNLAFSRGLTDIIKKNLIQISGSFFNNYQTVIIIFLRQALLDLLVFAFLQAGLSISSLLLPDHIVCLYIQFQPFSWQHLRYRQQP